MRRVRHYLKRGERVSYSAKTAVEGFLGYLQFDPSLYPVFEIWDKETKPYVRGCHAIGLQGTRICVRVPSSVHRHELMFHKDRVLNKVNQALGRNVITDIQFELETHEMKGER